MFSHIEQILIFPLEICNVYAAKVQLSQYIPNLFFVNFLYTVAAFDIKHYELLPLTPKFATLRHLLSQIASKTKIMLSPRAAALFRLHLLANSFHALRRQFFLHAMTNLPLFKRIFITKFVTHIRNFVTCITKFVTRVRKFVTKTLL